MLYRMNDLCGVDVKTTDGQTGKVTDFLIDEEAQQVQFLQIDNGGLFSEDPVLIPRKFLGDADESKTAVAVELKERDFSLCPTPEDFSTVSELYQQELEKSRHLSAPGRRAFFGNMLPVSVALPEPARKIVDERGLNSTLRSFNEINGYRLVASDGDCGYVKDVLVDDLSWEVKYYVVSSSWWNPLSSPLVIPAEYIDDIRCANEKVTTTLSRGYVKKMFKASIN